MKHEQAVRKPSGNSGELVEEFLALSESRSASNRSRVSRGESQRRIILQAGIEAFGRLGYEGASMRKIATAANLEVGHIAYYYATKEGLWRDAVRIFAGPVEAMFAEEMAVHSQATTEEIAKSLLPRFLNFCADNQWLTCVMMQEFSISSPRHDWLVESFGRPIWNLAKPLFVGLHKKGLLSGASPAVAYLNYISAGLITFGNTDVVQRITGVSVKSKKVRNEQITLIMRSILQPG